MIYLKFTLTVNHPDLEEPIVHERSLEGTSLSAIVKTLNISGQQACELKQKQTTSWTDPHGALHTLSLKPSLILPAS